MEMKSRPDRRTVDHKWPRVGATLVAKYKGSRYRAKVVSGSDGNPEVEYGGRRFRSMSTAAKAVTGNWVNGWKFWKVSS
jgi:hypothetical protein